MSCPIVFIHQGPPAAMSHLNCALLQARLWNPGRSICVITDEAPSALLAVPGIEIIHPELFSSGARELREVYRHFSSNGEHFERACLERWFVLRDFLRDRKLASIWHFDSDVMIYTDLNQETDLVEDIDFTLTHGSGHSSYFKLTALEKFCTFMLESYRQEPSTGWLQATDEAKIKAQRRDRISDMFFISELCQEPTLRSADLHRSQQGQAVFDANANAYNTAEREGQLREITFIDNRPHSTEDAAFPQQRYATLHFQGAAKCHMANHLRPPPGPLPDWCVPVLTQCLSQLRELSLQSLNALSAPQVVTPPRREVKTAKKPKTDQAVIKLLGKLRTSRWLRLGQFLGVSRSSAQLQEAMDRLRK
jgi:hypothetical protein